MKVVQTFIKNSFRNFNYFIYSDSTKEGIFVDPFDIEQTLPEAKKRGVKPKYLINTHHHPDHIRHNEKYLALPETQYLKLEHKQRLKLSDTEYLESIFTPGPVFDHHCFCLYEHEKLVGVITGDTVFNAGVGNCKNGGNPQQLYETIRDYFLPLPDDVIIYPSHDYLLTNLKFALTQDPHNKDVKELMEERERMDLDHEFIRTNIGIEKKINPFFRAFEHSFCKGFGNKNENEVFIELRSRRDRW